MASTPQRRYIVVIVAMVVTSGCAFFKKSDVDKISGPIGGTVTGSEVAGEDHATANLGHLLGLMSNKKINGALDDEDIRLMSSLVHSVLNHGADNYKETWRNGRSRHHGSFVARSTWSTSDRIECRRFINTIYVGESEARASGTACRQRDGTWTIMG